MDEDFLSRLKHGRFMSPEPPECELPGCESPEPFGFSIRFKFSTGDLGKTPTTYLDESREDEQGLKQQMSSWERQWEFEHGYNMRYRCIAGIGVRQFAAADRDLRQITIYSIEGKVKRTIDVKQEPRDIASTRQDNRIIVVFNEHVEVFNQDGSLAFKFSTISSCRSIGVKDSGNILVGDKSRRVMTEHSPAGKVLRTISVTTGPRCLAILDERRVVLSDKWHVVVVDCKTGAQLVSVIKQNHCKIHDVCCWNCQIFVVIDGHIHWYDAEGQFQGCIGHWLSYLRCITFTTDGQFLVAAGYGRFAVYKNPLMEDKPRETALDMLEKPLTMQSTAGLKQRMSSLRLHCNRRPNWERQWGFEPDYLIWPGCIAGIGVRQFAAADRDSHQITIYSIEGKVDERTIFVGHDSLVWVIAFTRQGNRIIVICKDHVEVFNQDGSLAFKFSTISSDEAGKTDVDLCSIGVKESGNILVGDGSRCVITEHSQAGHVLRTISVTTKPLCLAILDEGRVVLSDHQDVVVVDCETGARLASIIKERYRYDINDVCCWNCHIFVATCNNHIHWYDAEGLFQGYIGHLLMTSKCITFTTDGQFLVAAGRYRRFAVYKNPLIEDKPGETPLEKPLTMQSTAGLKQQMLSSGLHCDRRQNWERQMKFKDDHATWSTSMAGIGVRQFAVGVGDSRQITIHSIEGKLKRTIKVKQELRAFAYARQGNRLIVVFSDHVEVLHQDDSLAYKFSTISSDKAGKTHVNLCSAAVKDSGNILVGDVLRRVITEHSPDNGKVLRTVSVTTKPKRLAILDEERVVLSDNQRVVVVNGETGAKLVYIEKERDYYRIADICCWNCRIFVAIYYKHIHWYDAEGQFQGCIDQGLKSPKSITFTTDGQFLVAAGYGRFAVYKNPLMEDKPRETALEKPLAMQSTADEDKDREASKTRDDSAVMKPVKYVTKRFRALYSFVTEKPAQKPSCPKTHLQLLLDEFNNQTANMSDSDRWETRLQLPYIALGYFDHKGGNLDLKEYGVHLTIPQGALPQGAVPQGQDPPLMYIYVDPTAPQPNKMTLPEVPLAPVVQCGPQGLKFEKSVILSFPHSASGKDDQITPRMRYDDPTEGEWEEFDGKAFFVTDHRVICLVDHFALFTVSGTPSDGSAKLLTLAAFGPVLDPTSGQCRVHSWNYSDKAAEMVRGPHSCPKTHLQLLLDEFSKHAANMNEIDRWKTCLQLPYVALGYFDHKGGNLDLKEYDVHLTIPQGALPQGQDPQQVYIYVDPTAPQLEKMTPLEVRLAHVVQCGPQGMKFEKSVILSFPHSAGGKDAQINPRMRHDDSTEGGWEEFDGKAMFVTDDRITFLVDHFTKFTGSQPVSDGSPTLLTLAAFGPVNPTSGRYRIRVHIWNHGDKETEMNVKGQEEEMSSRMLDVFKSLVFSLHQGDLVIEVTDLNEGWTTCRSSQENIAHENIRHIPSNSVTFDLIQQQQAAASSASHSDLYCNVLSYQKLADKQSSRNSVRFSICPQLNGPKGRPKVENQASRCMCVENAGSDNSSNLCTFCKEQFRLSFFRNQQDRSRPEEFRGLPEKVVMELCIHLDEDDADKRPRWKRLADNIGKLCKSKEDFMAYNFLQIFFEVCRASGKDNEQSVKCLIADLRLVLYNSAVEIIEEGMGNQVLEVAQTAEPVAGQGPMHNSDPPTNHNRASRRRLHRSKCSAS